MSFYTYGFVTGGVIIERQAVPVTDEIIPTLPQHTVILMPPIEYSITPELNIYEIQLEVGVT